MIATPSHWLQREVLAVCVDPGDHGDGGVRQLRERGEYRRRVLQAVVVERQREQPGDEREIDDEQAVVRVRVGGRAHDRQRDRARDEPEEEAEREDVLELDLRVRYRPSTVPIAQRMAAPVASAITTTPFADGRADAPG